METSADQEYCELFSRTVLGVPVVAGDVQGDEFVVGQWIVGCRRSDYFLDSQNQCIHTSSCHFGSTFERIGVVCVPICAARPFRHVPTRSSVGFGQRHVDEIVGYILPSGRSDRVHSVQRLVDGEKRRSNVFLSSIPVVGGIGHPHNFRDRTRQSVGNGKVSSNLVVNICKFCKH